MNEILCIIDGMTDESFEIKSLPNLGAAYEAHAHGLFNTTPADKKPESLGCILRLLGLPEGEIGKAARGWIEALGAGVPFAQEDLLLRTTCVSVSRKSGKIGGARENPPIHEPGFTQIGSYQGLLVLKGKGWKLDRIRTFPPYENPHIYEEFLLPRGDDELLAFALRNQTDDYAVVPWGQAVPGSLSVQYKQGAMIAAAPIVRGIARALGMRCEQPQGTTGDVDTDLAAKREAALAAARQGGPVCLHINGADEASHRADPLQKQEFLMRVDREIIGPLCDSGMRVLFCADHGASPATAGHLDGPQPFVLVNSGKSGEMGTFDASMALKLLKG